MHKSIQKLQKRQEQQHKKFYDKIVVAIKETITRAIYNNQTKCFYTIPLMSFGEPINDLDFVVRTLKKYLRRENIKLMQIDGLLVHLDWSKIERTNQTNLNELYDRYK